MEILSWWKCKYIVTECENTCMWAVFLISSVATMWYLVALFWQTETFTRFLALQKPATRAIYNIKWCDMTSEREGPVIGWYTTAGSFVICGRTVRNSVTELISIQAERVDAGILIWRASCQKKYDKKRFNLLKLMTCITLSKVGYTHCSQIRPTCHHSWKIHHKQSFLFEYTDHSNTGTLFRHIRWRLHRKSLVIKAIWSKSNVSFFPCKFC